MRPAALALALLLPVLTAGCIEVVAAGVPGALAKAHGWREDPAQRTSESAWLGLASAVTRQWEDPADGAGHPGRLWVYTLKAPITPDEDQLVPRLQDRLRAEAERQGIRLHGVQAQGERDVHAGARSTWFAYNGTATAGGDLFQSDAEVRIFGEVWTCRPARSVVVTVAIAQVTDARTVGGVLTQPNRDATTWREVVADPEGNVESVRGNDGLAWNVACT